MVDRGSFTIRYAYRRARRAALDAEHRVVVHVGLATTEETGARRSRSRTPEL